MIRWLTTEGADTVADPTVAGATDTGAGAGDSMSDWADYYTPNNGFGGGIAKLVEWAQRNYQPRKAVDSEWEKYYVPNHGFGHGLNYYAKLATRDMFGQTHGREKAQAGMLPGYGYLRWMFNEGQKAEDYYQNTGQDPRYSSDVSSLGTPSLSQMTGGVVPRMARTMDQLYRPEIIEYTNPISMYG